MYLKINHLTKKYDSFLAINNICFEQKKGEVISLIGASGSGKTTLLKCISGVSDFENGSIYLNNIDQNNISVNQRNIAYLFQESPLFPHLNILENILINFKNYDDSKLNSLLLALDIKKIINKYPYEISGGESQRAAVVRSLIRKPNLLLLDEPFSHLDNVSKKKLKDIVYEIIKKTKMTTIIVNHDLHESLEISDRIIVLKDGEIVDFNTPEMIYKNPSCLYTARLFSEINKLSYDNSIFYVRPEDLIVVLNSNYKLKVENVFYVGGKYRVNATCNNESIIFYSPHKLLKGDSVYVDFNKNSILTFD